MHVLSSKKILGLLWVTIVTTFVMSACNGVDTSGHYALLDEVAYTGHIRMSLAHPFDAKNEDYEILLSAPFDVLDMAVCEISEVAPCQPGSPLYFKSELVYATPQRRFYKSVATALMEDGLKLKLMSLDKSGKVLDERPIMFKKVGGTTIVPPSQPANPAQPGQPANPAQPGQPAQPAQPANPAQPSNPGQPNPGQPSTGGGTIVDIATVKPIVSRACGRCHSSYASDPESLKSTGAADMVKSGSMPKGGSMDAGDKATLLKFLGAN